ncbi:MAG: hypothetical protein RIS35_1050 [Pseudomonadota bacterium]
MSVSPAAPADPLPLTVTLTAGQRSRNITALTLLTGVGGLSGVGLAILEQFSHGTPGRAAAIAGAGLLLCAVAAFGLNRASSSGRLEIDDDGSARWAQMPPARPSDPNRPRSLTDPSSPNGGAPSSVFSGTDAPARPFLPGAWFSFAGIVWLSGHCDGRSVRLMLGQDRLTDGEALRLRRWLRWLDRGGHTGR